MSSRPKICKSTDLQPHYDKGDRIYNVMVHLIPVGEGLGIQIPPDLLKAAHLDDASDLFFEVTTHGLLIKSTQAVVQIEEDEERFFAKLADAVDMSKPRISHEDLWAKFQN